MKRQLRKVFSEAERKEGSKAKASLIINLTEDVLVHMEDKNITKADIARILGKSRAYVSGLFSCERNMTLNTFSDICFAVGVKPEVMLVDTKDNNIVNYNKVRHNFISSCFEKYKPEWKREDNVVKQVVFLPIHVNHKKTSTILKNESAGGKYAYSR